MMKLTIVVCCMLGAGLLFGISVGVMANAKAGVAWVLAIVFLFLVGAVAGAWPFSPDGPFHS